MRFTLRDLCWLMLVVGVATAWLILLFRTTPQASTVKGMVYCRGKPFDGRIFLRSPEGVVISAPVNKGSFNLKYCTSGTYEVIYEGAEEVIQYLNGGSTIQIGRWRNTSVQFGIRKDADISMGIYRPIAKRRDNWRISREEELNE